MKLNVIKKPDERIVKTYDNTLDMKLYDYDNLYPQTMALLIAGSSAGSTCTNRYIKAINGGGFEDEDLAQTIVNGNGDSLNELLSFIARDKGKYGGVALHINYNIQAEITSISHIPFEECRLHENDDSGYTPFILRHPDWSGKSTRSGKVVEVNKNTVEEFNVFNPLKKVVLSQIQQCGGIDKYKGQILYTGTNGNNRYPISKADIIRTELSTDEALSNISYRNARHSFLPATVITMMQSNVRTLSNRNKTEVSIEDEIEAKQKEQAQIEKGFLAMQGDENSSNIALFTYANPENKPERLDLGLKNYDKDFTVTEERTKSRIYAAYEQEIFYSINIGKIGFSGQIVKEAFEYYANQTENERAFISNIFKKIARYTIEDLFKKEDNFEIKPPIFKVSEEEIVEPDKKKKDETNNID